MPGGDIIGPMFDQGLSYVLVTTTYDSKDLPDAKTDQGFGHNFKDTHRDLEPHSSWEGYTALTKNRRFVSGQMANAYLVTSRVGSTYLTIWQRLGHPYTCGC